MQIRCVWEHNGGDSLLYAENLIGAFTRGASLDIALAKMPQEAASYLKWRGEPVPARFAPAVVQEKASELTVCDADSDVLFDAEQGRLCMEEYEALKALAMKSARDFQSLYDAIPRKDESCLAVRKTFYGQIPRTAFEMYEHTKNVNDYYFGEIGVETDHDGSITDCRARGFARLEQKDGFLENAVYRGSYDEQWSLRKVLRRFIWHDRVHAKAMYRMAVKTFGEGICNPFYFDLYTEGKA